EGRRGRAGEGRGVGAADVNPDAVDQLLPLVAQRPLAGGRDRKRGRLAGGDRRIARLRGDRWPRDGGAAAGLERDHLRQVIGARSKIGRRGDGARGGLDHVLAGTVAGGELALGEAGTGGDCGGAAVVHKRAEDEVATRGGRGRVARRDTARADV